ncbi:MAG: hypothetical protein ACKPKO_35230, partial [Candidatus Fonsibacter sp.]
RIKGVFGIRAVVGHTGMPFLEDDRLMVDLRNAPHERIPSVVHNTRIENRPSILKKGLIPGGGETTAVHSQLSAFHIMESRLQESSRARATDAIIFFYVDGVRLKLMVAMSGVLVTRESLPSTTIDRIWIRRSVLLTDNRGQRTNIRSWVTMADRRVSGLRITGWLGVLHPSHSPIFKEIKMKLEKDPENKTVLGVYREYINKCGTFWGTWCVVAHSLAILFSLYNAFV